jgi:hypothetical protein
MGMCKEIYDTDIDNVDFVIDLMWYHGRYQFSETELNRMKLKENLNGLTTGAVYRGVLSQ